MSTRGRPADTKTRPVVRQGTQKSKIQTTSLVGNRPCTSRVPSPPLRFVDVFDRYGEFRRRMYTEYSTDKINITGFELCTGSGFIRGLSCSMCRYPLTPTTY